MTARATPAWAWHAGWALVVLALSGLAWWLTGQLAAGFFCMSLLFGFTQMFLDMGKALRPGLAAWRQRGFRLSIGRVMVLVGLAAGYLGLMRALHDAYPIEDVGMRLTLWGFFLSLYTMACVLGYALWSGVLRVQAVVAGDRGRHPGLRPEGWGDVSTPEEAAAEAFVANLAADDGHRRPGLGPGSLEG